MLVKQFAWSLHDINQTDIVDLLRVVNRLTSQRQGAAGPPGRGAVEKRVVHCDQANWL